jgi:uncharacterized protein YjbI with pentapeptide repeats
MPPAKPHHAAAHDAAPAEIDDHGEWNSVLAEGDYVAAGAEELTWTDVIARGGRWSGATFSGFRATDVRFENCDLAGFVLQEDSSLRRVEFVGCRMTGAVFAGSHLRDVRFASCALDDANFRMVDGQDLAFEDCTLTGADFYAAKLSKVVMPQCDLRGVALTKATLSDVDLRGARLEDVVGADALRGATVDALQVISLARSLAVALGVTVVDDG